MKTYNIFRRGEYGSAPSWLKGEEDLELAKLEARRLAAESNRSHFVLDLATSKMIYRTEAPVITTESVLVRP